MPRLSFNKWTSGISNDPNAGGIGSIYDGEGIEIRTNMKRVALSKNGGLPTQLTADISKYIVAYLIYDNTKLLRFHRTGEVTNGLRNDIDNLTYVTDLGTNIYNSGFIQTTAGARGFAIGDDKIYKWNYDTSSTSLGMYNESEAGIVVNGDFNAAGSWTVGLSWAISGGKATHTPGSSNNLFQNLVTVNTQAYRVQATGSCSAGSCEVKMSVTTIGTITPTNTDISGIRTATSTGEELTFIPTADFDGYIEDVRVQAYNVTSQTHTSSFNAFSPYLILENEILIGNGNTLVSVDTSTVPWVISDSLVIDLDYTIKGITKIGDQFFIYASNGSASKQILWDGASTSVSRSITWIDKPIMNVANFANIDYVITGGNSGNKTQLSRVDGYQLTPLYQNELNTDNSLERIYFNPSYTNGIETIGTSLLIPGYGNIYSFGQFTPGLPYSLVKEFTHFGETVTAMSFNESSNFALYYSFIGTVNGAAGIYETQQFLGASGYPTAKTGFFSTSPIFGEDFSNIKNSEKIVCGYRMIDGSHLIAVYHRADEQEGYATIQMNYGATVIPAVGAVYSTGGVSFTITGTSYINSSFVLLHCTYTGTTRPKSGTLTKVSGTGDATFYSEKIRHGYKFIGNITDGTKRRETVNIPFEYNENRFAVEMMTSDNTKTPYFYNLDPYYGETDDN